MSNILVYSLCYHVFIGLYRLINITTNKISSRYNNRLTNIITKFCLYYHKYHLFLVLGVLIFRTDLDLDLMLSGPF